MADKTFEENVSAQLAKSKSQMKEIETLAKGKASQAALDAIAALKNKKQEIENKVQALKNSADTKAKAELLKAKAAAAKEKAAATKDKAAEA